MLPLNHHMIMLEDHKLELHGSRAGLTMGACTCGRWGMKVGPDALVGQAASLEELVTSRYRAHLSETMRTAS